MKKKLIYYLVDENDEILCISNDEKAVLQLQEQLLCSGYELFVVVEYGFSNL